MLALGRAWTCSCFSLAPGVPSRGCQSVGVVAPRPKFSSTTKGTASINCTHQDTDEENTYSLITVHQQGQKRWEHLGNNVPMVTPLLYLKASKLAEKPAEETEGFFTGRTGNIYSHSSARTGINGNLSYCGRADQERNTMPWEGQVKTLSWRLLRPLSINQMWFRVNTSKLQHKLSWKDWMTNLFNLIPIQTDLPALPWSV